MRRSAKLILLLTVVLSAGLAVYSLAAVADDNLLTQDFLETVAATKSDKPQDGLASYWFECLQRVKANGDGTSDRTLCKTWTAEGLTSELIALKVDDQIVPVIESRLVEARPGPVVVDITGGPGGTPFYVNPMMTEKEIAELKLQQEIEEMENLDV